MKSSRRARGAGRENEERRRARDGGRVSSNRSWRPDDSCVSPSDTLLRSDRAEWRPLWDGYNAFYGRGGPTALAESITERTWERFFSDSEAVHALVAEDNGHVIGLAHYVFHRSTTRLNDVCYLQDLFTAENARGRGVGRQLILAVYEVGARGRQQPRLLANPGYQCRRARALRQGGPAPRLHRVLA